MEMSHQPENTEHDVYDPFNFGIEPWNRMRNFPLH